jgi:hypothetical protein
MTGPATSRKHFNPAYQLAELAVLLALMYMCTRTLRFTNDWLNLVFDGPLYSGSNATHSG